MKIALYYVTLWSLTQAAYVSRMATVNRIRGPTPMRPGLMLTRAWSPPRYIQAASHRSPYVIYRNLPHRYAMKHQYVTNISPTVTRGIFSSPWKSTVRLPPVPAVTPDYDFIRTASSAPVTHSDGAIHTIPAPNLSLSEKPIVVVDNSDSSNTNTATEETKPVYEVTEKYPEPPVYPVSAKIEPPVGFSKPNTFVKPPELQNVASNNAVLQQLINEYGLSAMAAPHASIIPQQFSFQGYNRIPTQQDLLHTGSDGIIIPPNVLYQQDPMYLQKLQNHILQHFPAVEFIPYAANPPFQPPAQPPPQTQAPEQNNLFLLENEQFVKQPPSSFIPSNPDIHKNLVQRETQEATVLTLLPQGFSVNNATANSVDVTNATQPQNVTIDLVTSEVTNAPTTTPDQVMEPSTENQRTTPIYYAQVGQSVANVIANGFYSAINDVRAATALAQLETAKELPRAQPFNTTSTTTTTTTTTLQPDLQAYFVQTSGTKDNNQTGGELKPLLGAPFEKAAESVNVAYTLLRADKVEQSTTKDGVVYAGQLVEATISEDQDFNKEKANILARRPPLRLFSTPDKRSTETPQKVTVVKAKIPPKSKLTYDDKTGEPVLRIYASYLDSPAQKERLTTKLANMKYNNEAITRKQDLSGPKAVDKTQGSDKNQVTQFGLKLRSRSDEYLPLFDN